MAVMPNGMTTGSGDVQEHEDRPSFESELEALINKFSMESGSNTPEFILAEYMSQCLKSFNAAVCAREAWHGRGMEAYSVTALND